MRRVLVGGAILLTALATTAAAGAADSGNDPRHDSDSAIRPSSASVAALAKFDPNADGIALTKAAGFDPRGADRSEVRQAILDYWTPRNLRAAMPVAAHTTPTVANLVTSTNGIYVSRHTPARGETTVVKPAGPTGEKTRLPRPNILTVGRLFFTDSNGDRGSCSASVQASASKRMISTAGHCVHEGDGDRSHWMSNSIFFPAYDDGDHPEGRFPVFAQRTFYDWVDYGADDPRGLLRDVAFVTLGDGENARARRIQNAVGGHGIVFNKAGNWTWWAKVFGYPRNINSGERLARCALQQTSQEEDQPPYQRQRIGCEWEPGASGGPWLWKYDNQTGYGTTRSVTSYAFWDGSDDRIIGPPFDDLVRTMYTRAEGDWGG